MKRMRFLFAMILLALANQWLFAATTINPGNISGLWSVSGSPYLIYGNVTVPYGSTLSIDPGVQVIFQGHYSMTVQGKILAIGDVSFNILFTINDTTGAANRSTPDGTWAGIMFTSNGNEADTSKFIYCTMSYARNAIYISHNHNVEVIKSSLVNNYGDIYGAAIYINNPNCYVLVNECLITKNFSNISPAIYCNNGINVNIWNNEISYNKSTYTAGAINFSENQGGIITGNTIKFNSTTGQSVGAIRCSGENIEISRNIIHDNTGKSAGGIYFGSTYNSICINNTFINNYSAWNGGGIECWESNIEISNNVICNNTSSNGPGGIDIRNSDVVLAGNTICNNKGTTGGGISFSQSETQIYNTILWGNSSTNGSQVYIYDNFSSPNIYYSDVQYGTGGFGYSAGTSFNGEYLNNLQLTPQFASPAIATGINVNAMLANWSIKTSSPCINAGTPDLSDLEIPDYDCNGNPRVRNGRIDIGAYESHIDKIFASGTISSNTEWIADSVEVTGDIYIPDNITLRIPPGTRVSFTGHFKINVHGTLLATGTYEENIIFKVKDTTGFSQTDTISGSWDGIDFNNGPWTWVGGANGIMNDNDSSVLTYCVLQNAKSKFFGGAILIDHFSRIRIENCVIQHCGAFGSDIQNFGYFKGGGLYCVYGNPILRNTKIENNYCEYYGGGIFIENSDMLIENCTINDNRSYQNSGAGIYMNDAAPIINNTLISNNISNYLSKSDYPGGGILCDNSNPVFTNCKILNNRSDAGGAAAFLYNGQPVFINCLFANNFGGSIIVLYSSDGAIFINNTIVSNAAAALLFDASAAKIYNTIIWGNNNQFWIYEPTQTKIDIYNSIIQDGIPNSYITEGLVRNYVNVSEFNPQFINPSSILGYDKDAILKDYTVSSFSPSINAGTTNIPNHIIPGKDLNGNPRIIADSVDIGAFEHQGGKIFILDQPTGGTICEGEAMSLSVTVNDTAHVQWQKDGVEIPGANAYNYIVDSVSSIDQGNYRCLVSNAYGITTSEQTAVFVTLLPRVQIIDNNPYPCPRI